MLNAPCICCQCNSARTDLHLGLDPGPDHIGLVGKLSAQTLVVLLPCVFLNQSLVALRHQLPDLQPAGAPRKNPNALLTGVKGRGAIDTFSEILCLFCKTCSINNK